MSPRPLRADAEANRERLLAIAAEVFRRDGPRVPMADIAARAGVGVGTLYRHFPDRDELLGALEHHSYRLTLDMARAATVHEGRGIDALRAYLAAIISSRDRLFLPLHGGPMSADRKSRELRAQIGAAVAAIVDRGKRDGSIRADATPLDVIIGATFFCQPLPNAGADWDTIARRQTDIFIAGMAPQSPSPTYR
jgi:AcrR family transcriptional regulator